MAKLFWTLDDIPWAKLDRSKIDPDQEKLARAAAMVAFNAADDMHDLRNLFHDDPLFIEAADHWGTEKRQHGEVLATWAHLVDPSFDVDARFQTFRDGFRRDAEATQPIRGARAGALVARCMVEVGNSAYYTALGDACEEPVLRAICRKIASDEQRHYKLFYEHLKRYLEVDGLSTLQRLRVALGQIAETKDDAMSYAFYAVNAEVANTPHHHTTDNTEYLPRAYRDDKEPHIERGMAMIFKACGLKPHSRLFGWVNRGARWMLARKQRKLAAASVAA